LLDEYSKYAARLYDVSIVSTFSTFVALSLELFTQTSHNKNENNVTNVKHLTRTHALLIYIYVRILYFIISSFLVPCNREYLGGTHVPELSHRCAEPPRGAGCSKAQRGKEAYARFPATAITLSRSQQLTQLFQETSELPIIIWVMGTAQNGPLPRQDRAVCRKIVGDITIFNTRSVARRTFQLFLTFYRSRCDA